MAPVANAGTIKTGLIVPFVFPLFQTSACISILAKVNIQSVPVKTGSALWSYDRFEATA